MDGRGVPRQHSRACRRVSEIRLITYIVFLYEEFVTALTAPMYVMTTAAIILV